MYKTTSLDRVVRRGVEEPHKVVGIIYGVRRGRDDDDDDDDSRSGGRGPTKGLEEGGGGAPGSINASGGIYIGIDCPLRCRESGVRISGGASGSLGFTALAFAGLSNVAYRPSASPDSHPMRLHQMHLILQLLVLAISVSCEI